MNFYNFLQEKFLLSEWKFGFELEGIFNDLNERSFIIEDILKIFGGQTKVVDDESIKHTTDQFSLEIVSQVYNLNIKNIESIFKNIEKLFKMGLQTNKSCGFHVHLSFPTFNEIDAAWILCNIALDNDFLKKIIHFKDYRFLNKEFASLEDLKNIRNGILNNNIQLLNVVLSENKNQIIRLHPQGTIEWRGPRDFLNNKNMDEIKEFFKFVWYFVSKINSYLDIKQLHNIKKEDLKDILYKIDTNYPMFVKSQNGKDVSRFYSENADYKLLKLEEISLLYKNNQLIINSGLLINRSSKKIKIENAILNNIGLYKIDLINCSITSKEPRVINKINLEKCKIYSGSFSWSKFYNCKIKITDYSSSSFFKCEFYDCEIEYNHSLKHIDTCLFKNCIIKDYLDKV